MKNTDRKKKVLWQQYIGYAFMVLIGAACGVLMALLLNRSAADTPPFQLILTLVGVYVALFFHTIVHEAGHLIFGLLTGYRFSSFRIASFMWVKENGKLKQKRLSLAGTGGQCLMAPPDIQNGEMPLVLYNLGGSLINVIVGALFLIGYLFCADLPILSLLLLIFAVVGFMVAMANGIPMRMGAIDNDGYNAFALSRNKEAVKAFWVQLKVNEQCAKGIRLKDMPAEWFAVPTDEAMKNSMIAVQGVFACNRLMDEERFPEADALIAHLLELDSGIVGLHHDLLMCDRIYVELIGENRREVIENRMSKGQRKFMKAMKRFPSVLRTEYALALLFEKDAAKAEATKAKFEKIAKTYPYPNDIASERELMEIAERRSAAKE